MNRKASIFIGFDPREADAFAVAAYSTRRWLKASIPVGGVVLDLLRARGFYKRPTETKVGPGGHRQLIDVLSIRPDYDGAMSTEFAISRFLVPHLAREGLAAFIDADMLVRINMEALFHEIEQHPGKAVYCVQHDYEPVGGQKMDGQAQSRYARKNWSSVMVFDCDHPENAALTLDYVNSVPGRDLHAFSWLKDEDIGSLGPEWNWLVGHSSPTVEPKIVHFTEGVPSMPGYANVAYADEWRGALAAAARGAFA